MATYGNTGGRNKGKKYKKLTGLEVATPDSQARANDFLQWYADNYTALRDALIFDHLYDEDMATETALKIYDCIAYKGFIVASPKWYYLRAYHTARIARPSDPFLQSLDAPLWVDGRGVTGAGEDGSGKNAFIKDKLAASTFDYEAYEKTVDGLTNEILEYVRGKYDQVAVSLFEIYVGLQPDISYTQLSVMLNYPRSEIWTSIGKIKKDIVETFDEHKRRLLSSL